jgi:hypothetical protein
VTPDASKKLFPAGRTRKFRVLIEPLFVNLGVLFYIPPDLVKDEAVEIFLANPFF